MCQQLIHFENKYDEFWEEKKNGFFQNILQIEKGENFTLCLTKQGHLYRNNNNNCWNDLNQCLEMEKWSLVHPIKTKQICFKKTHALILTENGYVFSLGENDKGQLV